MTLTRAPIEAPITTPTKTTADVLRNAARYLEEFGWRSLTYTTIPGGTCAGIAIDRVADNVKQSESAIFAVLTYLGLSSGPRTLINFYCWNDEQRTAAPVLAALRAAADAAEQSGV